MLKAMENTRPKTKLDIITGFLGAGKTTFIRHYANWLHSRRVSFNVIENEFGTAGVDTGILRGDSITTSELAGGCICCSLKVNFHNMLVELAGCCDRIIVEPSGIFDMDEFFDIARSPAVSRLFEIGCVVTIVDPVSLKCMKECEYAILRSQLLSTGRILLSKTQSLSPNQIDWAVDQMNMLINTDETLLDLSSIVENLNWEYLTDVDLERISTSQPVIHAHKRRAQDHTNIFNSTTLYPARCFTHEELGMTLQALFDGSCGTVLRVKGRVNSADGSLSSVNCTASDILIESMKGNLPPMLNIIGRGLKRARIAVLFT